MEWVEVEMGKAWEWGYTPLANPYTNTHTSAGVYRLNYSEVIAHKGAPAIPVQPISYGDAMHFLRCVKYSR